MSRARPKRRGRPRDPSVDSRVHQAALELFGDAGWSGFNLQQVAQMAGVGKGSIYLRWPNRESLLLDALQSQVRFIDDPNAGSLEGNLHALGKQIAHAYEGYKGRAYLRAILEGPSIPGLEAYTQFLQDQMHLARVLIRRDLPPEGTPVRVTTLLSALGGTLLVHMLTAPPGVIDSEEGIEEVVDDLVRLLLHGAVADESLVEPIRAEVEPIRAEA